VSIVDGLRGGDPDAFGDLWDRYALRIFGYAYLMVGDEAAEAVCETFAAASRRSPDADASAADVELWLFGLVRTECLLRPPDSGVGESEPMRRAVARLRPEHREALALTGVARLRAEQVASVLKVAPDTAAQIVATARERLEQAVSSILATGGPTPEEAETIVAAVRAGTSAALMSVVVPPVPLGLRERALAAAADNDLTVTIGDPRGPRRHRPNMIRRTGGVRVWAAAAACLAMAVGIVALRPVISGQDDSNRLPATHSSSGAPTAAVSPSASTGVQGTSSPRSTVVTPVATTAAPTAPAPTTAPATTAPSSKSPSRRPTPRPSRTTVSPSPSPSITPSPGPSGS
jgi:DNA-directed RNA polymerase specialized sigma24 family protein